MVSFERGLANSMGRKYEVKADDVRATVDEWLIAALSAGSENTSANTRNNIDNDSKTLSYNDFKEFCINAKLPVCQLLDKCKTSQIADDTEGEVTEIVNTLDVISEPSGGDEWLATPTWIKTAEKMLPTGHTPTKIQPVCSLELDWVHGFRGHDCRNNISYIHSSDSSVHAAFTAAGVSIVQTTDTSSQSFSSHQYFFAEHSDDIVCHDTCVLHDGTRLIATGEVGRSPVIHVYKWNPADCTFEALACMKGYFGKAVVQICFSKTQDKESGGNPWKGLKLFAVGADYKVAVYNVDQSNSKKFGKMLASAQGPKGKVFHCCASLKRDDFMTTGEKHIIAWQMKDMKLVQMDIRVNPKIVQGLKV
jgi:hypothetical protein